jgi:hypothetical protein
MDRTRHDQGIRDTARGLSYGCAIRGFGVLRHESALGHPGPWSDPEASESPPLSRRGSTRPGSGEPVTGQTSARERQNLMALYGPCAECGEPREVRVKTMQDESGTYSMMALVCIGDGHHEVS